MTDIASSPASPILTASLRPATVAGDSGLSVRARLRAPNDDVPTQNSNGAGNRLPDPARYRERVSVIEAGSNASNDAGARLQKRNDLSFSVQKALRDYADTESAPKRAELSELLGVDLLI